MYEVNQQPRSASEHANAEYNSLDDMAHTGKRADNVAKIHE
jgi:hypothetical protein